jgi:hypothetical protein
MLILSTEYVEEHGGNARNLALFGQETNGVVWSISKLLVAVCGWPSRKTFLKNRFRKPMVLVSALVLRPGQC